MNKSDSGITLVALTVTIVVLMILSGITLSLVLGDNGIIQKAKNAKKNYSIAQEEEENNLNNASSWIEKQTEKNDNQGNSLPQTETTKPYLPENFTQVGNTNLTSGLEIKDQKENQYVWVEVPKTLDVYKTAGLTITSFTDEEYTKIENDLHTYTSVYRKDGWTDTCYSTEQTGMSNDQYYTLKKQMLKSLYQKGGFWVAKYEVGDSNSTINNITRTETSGIANTPIIKEGQEPYNFVTCSQAETLAKRLNPNSSKYITSLMFGVQWDLILKYIEQKGTKQDDLNFNSISWGNYKNSEFDITKGKYNVEDTVNWKLTDWKNVNEKYTKGYNISVLLTSGENERNSKQGIYDLAGNSWEWTLEYSSNTTYPCAERGGSYLDDGSKFMASYRNIDSTTSSNKCFGFRVSLFEIQ